MNRRKIAVIGGGASGLAATIRAAECGADVAVIEKKEQAGKKLLLTGNGRCNLTNTVLSADYYRGPGRVLTEEILERFGTEELCSFFESLGLYLREQRGGIYPRTMQAQSVLSVLLNRVRMLGIRMVYNTNVTGIGKEDGKFVISTDSGVFHADAVILACGSEAGVKDRRPFSAVRILRELGHTVEEPRPALTCLYGEKGERPGWEGVRVYGSVSFQDETHEGELQLTSGGISGIPVFQLSHRVSEALQTSEEAEIRMDFLPEKSGEDLLGILLSDRKSPVFGRLRADEYLKGMLPKNLIPAVMKAGGLQKKILGLYSEGEFRRLAEAIKHYPFRAVKTGSFQEAQTVSGGIDPDELKPGLESRIVPGLYITGELLNTHGLCGGYNLHLAFSSGLIAGEAAAGRGENDPE